MTYVINMVSLLWGQASATLSLNYRSPLPIRTVTKRNQCAFHKTRWKSPFMARRASSIGEFEKLNLSAWTRFSLEINNA